MAETGGHLVRNIISVRETDLNVLTNVGVYACEITDSVNQHAPFDGKALVEVFIYRTDDDIRYISQDIRGVDDFGRYTRTYDGSTWSAWQELAASEGGGGGTGTDLDFVRNATTVTVRSNTGTDAVLPTADASNAGILTADTYQQIGNTAWRAASSGGGLSNGFRASKSANQNISEASGKVLVTFPTENQDLGAHFASSRWTPGVAGIVCVGYRVAVQLVSGGGGTGSVFYLPEIEIRKNGAAVVISQTGGANISGAQVYQSFIIDACDSNDFYEIFASVEHSNTAPTMAVVANANTIFYGAYLI